MQRQCVFIESDVDDCQQQVKQLLATFESDKMLTIANTADVTQSIISHKQAQTQLGKEFDVIVFDGSIHFSADSFGAIVGTLTAGGILFVLLSASSKSLWLQRFKHIAQQYALEHDDFYYVHQGESLPALSLCSRNQLLPAQLDKTADQQQAVEAILKVVHGHRRRPLVISSDRGRGKSAALGMAAAELLLHGKQRLIVTAPSMATVDTLFEHAARLLPTAKVSAGHIELEQAEIKFVAPDLLLNSDLTADLLLVDEAAAIPSSMLEKLLHKFSRIVFATTLHGYEGTGRGFVVRFQQILDQATPNWRALQLSTPIRWTENDQLEAFSFEALLLNASPVADELVADATVEACEFELIDRQQLLTDPQSLAELFGLMVLAHYRTRPSDLQMMLDRDDVSVVVMRYQGHIVASSWLIKEGELEQELAEQVYAGNRRLKGHLLPQSLLAHVGIPNAGGLRYQRIIRLAVHPAIQNRGIGQALLLKIEQQLKQDECDVLGASFAVSRELIKFWHKAGFTPSKFGMHQDDVSGSHAVMMLRASSSQGHDLIHDASQRFAEQWTYILPRDLKEVDSALLIELSQGLSSLPRLLSHTEQQEILAFAHQQRGLEFSQYSLMHWLREQITQATFLQIEPQQQALCFKAILQQQSWPQLCEKLPYTGKKQALAALREAVRNLLELNKLPDGK